jgi:3(or 17)beta-hydroxysteroid dehydrogenase
MTKLAGKIVLVTGVADAVVRACAIALAADGAQVVCAGEAKAADATAAAAAEHGGRARGIAHDAASEADWQRLMADIAGAEGHLDALVNMSRTVLGKPMAQTTLADLRALEDANIVAPWLGLKYAIAAMRETGGGSIINVGGALAANGENGAADCAAAGALRVMTQAAALECGQARDNIRINIILAGARDATPEHVAQAVVFLASDGSSFMTGADVVLGSGQGAP